MANTDQLVTSIIEGILEIKGEDVIIIDLSNIPNAVTQRLVICTGNSDTHIQSIAGSIEDVVSKSIKEKPWQSEGKTNKEWILLDYSNVVVHLFKHETRNRYNLEGLWGDGEITRINPPEQVSQQK